MLVNKYTDSAVALIWSSEKIERMVMSSLAAEMLSLQKMLTMVYLVRRLMDGLCREEANAIPCIDLTDSLQ